MKRIILTAIFCLFATVYIHAQVPLPIDSATASQHLMNRPMPIYPAIARAARTSGIVTMNLLIDTNGQVVSASVLSGPSFLQEAALDAVRRYIYVPFEQNGKPIEAQVVTSVNFQPNGSVTSEGTDGATEFFEALLSCKHQLAEGSPADQVEVCGKAVQQVEMFPHGTRYRERGETYTDYAVALLQNGRSADAVAAGNNAIAVAKKQNNIIVTSAAYKVTSEALAATGNLAEADKNLTTAEKYEHKALHSASNETSKEHASQLMKSTLQFHAKILTTMGNQKEADLKLKQASKL